MTFEVGDIVRVREFTCLGTRNETPKGLCRDTTYRIANIHHCLDGAYDWDDLFLEGVDGKFCEFDFEKVSNTSKG